MPGDGVTVPLTYYPQYGIYTAQIKVGQDPAQEVEAIVDTGSSSLVFTADRSYCPGCKHSLTKGAIKPEKMNSAPLNKAFSLSYGSANDTATVYRAPIQVTDKKEHVIDMHIFVLKDSDQPSSILGMIHHNLREDLIKFTPFMAKLTNYFSKYKETTFVLCGEEGNSYFHVGEMKLPKPLFSSKLHDSKFYEITTYGFYTQQEKPIPGSPKQEGEAIIDTGTGGFIVLTDELYKPLLQYIKNHAGKKNQELDKQFWEQNYCLVKNAINIDAFPTLKIGFKTLNDQTGFLTLKPSTYINNAGCDKGYVRMVFMSGLYQGHPTAARNAHLRKTAEVFPEMIIGTSVLNEHPLHINHHQDPYVSFFKKEDFCNAGPVKQ